MLSHFFFFKQKTAYEMRISDWSSDVCSSDLGDATGHSIPYPNKGFGDASKVSGFMEYGLNLRNTLTLPNVGEAVFGVQRTSYRNDSDPVFPISHEWNTTTGVYLDARPTLPFSPDTKVSLAGRVDFSKAFDRSEEHTSEL